MFFEIALLKKLFFCRTKSISSFIIEHTDPSLTLEHTLACGFKIYKNEVKRNSSCSMDNLRIFYVLKNVNDTLEKSSVSPNSDAWLVRFDNKTIEPYDKFNDRVNVEVSDFTRMESSSKKYTVVLPIMDRYL